MELQGSPIMDPAALAELLWRPPLALAVLGVGVLVTLATVFVQLRRLPRALRAVRGEGAGWGLLVAGSAGMGAISGTTLAVTMGGPGALVWMWITAFLGMAITWAESMLAADPGEQRGFYMARHLGGLGRALAAVFAVGILAASVTAGGLFQTQQGGALLQSTLNVSPVAAAVVLALAAVPFLLVPAVRRIVLQVVVPAAIVLYLLAACTLAFADPFAASLALTEAIDAAFGFDAAGSGLAGGAVAVAIHHGVLRATFAGESGLGSAAVADLRGARRAAAMLVPLVTTGLLATATALVVVTNVSEEEPIADPKLVPLERVESRGLRPSQQVGQTIVLPLDTTMEAGKAYRMRLRASPRGHALGALRVEENEILLADWPIAAQTDTVVFRPREADLGTQPGWDVRVPVTRERVDLGDGNHFLRLKPADPELELGKLIARYELDRKPYVVLGDYVFAGRVGVATSPDPELGEHLAMFDRPDEDGPVNPKLHELFRVGYRGPYSDAEEEQPPWAFVAAEGFTPELGERLTLRLAADRRGEPFVRVNRAGIVEAPAWSFMLEVNTLVVRHQTDAGRDLRIPVRADLDHARVRFEVLDPAWKDFRRLEKMPEYEGPYALVPDFEFEAEVRSDARLSSARSGHRTLVPLHPHLEPSGPAEALPYHPHPAEVLASGMSGPFLAREGAEVVAARFGEQGAWRSWVLALAGFVLVVSTVGAWAEHGGRAAQQLLGHWAGAPARGAVILVAACGGLFSLHQVLGLADASIAIAAIPNLIAVVLCLPKLRGLARHASADADGPSSGGSSSDVES